MKKMGIEATFVDPLCTEEELNAAFRPNTKVVFGETIANPALTVLDIETFAQADHAHGVPAIVAMGRKGGSNVAAAICNALVYSAAEMLDLRQEDGSNTLSTPGVSLQPKILARRRRFASSAFCL